MDKIITNYIPSIHITNRPCLCKYSNIIPKEAIIQDVSVYEEALPYIECQMRNTIRHEAMHREYEEKGRPTNTTFEDWSSKGKAEPVAEQAETENCEMYTPEQVSTVQKVNVDAIFQKAKQSSGVQSAYLQDVEAAMLPDDILGLYGLQDHPEGAEFGTGWDGKQYINVSAFFKPWMAKEQKESYPPNVQFDGTEIDPDIYKTPQGGQSVPSVPSIPSVGGVPSR